MNNYNKMINTNWNRRIDKLRKTVYSWTGRYFSNIKQRIEVMNCFALSCIFYIAAVLPMTKTAVKNINSIVGDFIWRRSGKVLKIAYNEIVNSELRGGMGLLDSEAMCNSLITSQLFRLMNSSDIKSQNHLNFWMADYFERIWDGPSDYVTVGNCTN